MRVRDSQGDLLRAGDILGGLMPWEGGYEAAWWAWGKKSKLTQTWYWFRGNWAWVRTSMINLDPYWILGLSLLGSASFFPGLDYIHSKFLKWWKQSHICSGAFCMPSRPLGTGLSQWGPIFVTYSEFWIQIFLDPFPDVITVISYKNTVLNTGCA